VELLPVALIAEFFKFVYDFIHFVVLSMSGLMGRMISSKALSSNERIVQNEWSISRPSFKSGLVDDRLCGAMRRPVRAFVTFTC